MERSSALTGPRVPSGPPPCEPTLHSRAARRHPARLMPSHPREARHTCHAADPALMQDVLMGGAVVTAVGAALVAGMKSEPEVCSSCAGSGGVRCFACEGTGKMSGIGMEELAKAAAAQRDPLGRNPSKRECLACKGAGMLFCKKCSGSGYVSK